MPMTYRRMLASLAFSLLLSFKALAYLGEVIVNIYFIENRSSGTENLN